MSVYKVPFDFRHEEKVFGGYLSVRQMLYLMLGIASTGIIFIPIIPMLLKIIMLLIIFTILLIFAFVRIGTSYADKHFMNILKFIFRKKIFI